MENDTLFDAMLSRLEQRINKKVKNKKKLNNNWKTEINNFLKVKYKFLFQPITHLIGFPTQIVSHFFVYFIDDFKEFYSGKLFLSKNVKLIKTN